MAGDETWSTPEMVRAITDIKRTLTEIRKELHDQRGEYLPREVYASDQRSLAEYKADVAKDVVDLGAEQARIRKDLRAEVDAIRAGMRWGLALTVTAAGVVAAVVNTMGLGA